MVLKPLKDQLPPARPSRTAKGAREGGTASQGGPAMIMRSGQQLLLPASPVFIVAACWSWLCCSTCCLWASRPGCPTMLALVLVFWTVHQPLRVGIGAAFRVWPVMDVHRAGLLGQHALVLHRIELSGHHGAPAFLWFAVPTQALQVLPLLWPRMCSS
jgi:rod shape-determining protein MreD